MVKRNYTYEYILSHIRSTIGFFKEHDLKDIDLSRLEEKLVRPLLCDHCMKEVYTSELCGLHPKMFTGLMITHLCETCVPIVKAENPWMNELELPAH